MIFINVLTAALETQVITWVVILINSVSSNFCKDLSPVPSGI